jgi:hypothetical protein
MSEHDGANLHAADDALAIEFDAQGLTGEFALRDGQDGGNVDIDSMTTFGLDGGDDHFIPTILQ